MKRNSRSRRKKDGFRRVLTSPLTPVLLGLAIVLGVGYWAMKETPANAPSDPPSSQTDAPPAGGDSTPVVENETNQPGAPLSSEPTKNPEEPAGSEPPETEPSSPPANTSPAQPPVQAEPSSRSQIDRSGGAASTMLVTAYYADGLNNGLSLQPVEIQVPQSLTPIKDTVEQLLNPPTSLDLHSNFPPGTHALGYNLKEGGVAIVDLSPEAAEVRGTAAVNTIMASLVYSLTEIPGVEAVQLWINGSPAVLDGVDWPSPLSRTDMENRNLFHVEPVIPYSGS